MPMSLQTKNTVLKEIVLSIPTHRLKQWVIDALDAGYITDKPDYRSRKSMSDALLELSDYQIISLISLPVSL